MEADELDRLRSPEGRAVTAAATERLERGQDLLAVNTALRRDGADPDLVAAALTLARLRIRARAKFGADADLMYWTEAGLEQSTRAVVAAHRARRFATFGPEHAADLCCGVGGDLTALAAAGVRVTGFDSDPVTAATAAANLEALGLTTLADVRVADVTAVDLAGFDALFVDPARRTSGGRRRFDPEGYAPPYSWAVGLAAAGRATGLKVAPGIPHHLVPPDAEAEWVSVDGDVKEAALWFGPLAGRPGGRRATLLSERAPLAAGAGPVGAVSLDDDPSLGLPAVRPTGTYLHEPDGAVIRAGLVAEVADRLGGWLLDPTIAYVSTDDAVESPYTHRYLVEEVMPFQLKRLRAALRERGVGDVVVKKRGSALDPEELRQRLRLDGDGPTRTLVLTRVAGTPTVLVTRPLARP